jgi:glycosyltransferase involved in cell wall biosynthesis
MSTSPSRLRVALLAGGLSQGGAEKQFVYMARGLAGAGVEVQVYCLTKGDYYEATLVSLGLPPVWIGRHGNPAVRVLALINALKNFRPHVVQSGHFFANMHVSLAAMPFGAVGIGCIRSDTYQEMKANGAWGRLLLRLPHAIIANSQAARNNVRAFGVDPGKIDVLPNVLDLAPFDIAAPAELPGGADAAGPLVTAVCRLVEVKRMDIFLEAVAKARQAVPGLAGLIVGDGPEGPRLRDIARDLGLLPGGVVFAGGRDDVPGVLKRSDIVVISSDHEGFPNVALEAMAARLPVVTTRVGDAPAIVEDGKTGYVVPVGDVDAMAARIIDLARDAGKRKAFGEAGRRKVEISFSAERVAGLLLATYRSIGERLNRKTLVRLATSPTAS